MTVLHVFVPNDIRFRLDVKWACIMSYHISSAGREKIHDEHCLVEDEGRVSSTQLLATFARAMALRAMAMPRSSCENERSVAESRGSRGRGGGSFS